MSCCCELYRESGELGSDLALQLICCVDHGQVPAQSMLPSQILHQFQEGAGLESMVLNNLGDHDLGESDENQGPSPSEQHTCSNKQICALSVCLA